MLVLAAAAVWALYSAHLKRYPAGLHPLAYLLAITVVGVAAIFPCYLLERATGRMLSFDVKTTVTILYLAVFASVLAFIFWNKAVRAIGANKAGPFVHLMPVFSTVLAVMFLDEQLAFYHAQGAGLIFLGILTATGDLGVASNLVQEDRQLRIVELLRQ